MGHKHQGVTYTRVNIVYYLGGGEDDVDVPEFFLLPNWPRKCIPPDMRFERPIFILCMALCSPSMFVVPPGCLFLLVFSSFLGFGDA